MASPFVIGWPDNRLEWPSTPLHYGLIWPVGIPTVFQTTVTAPLHRPNGRQIGLCKRWLWRSLPWGGFGSSGKTQMPRCWKNRYHEVGESWEGLTSLIQSILGSKCRLGNPSFSRKGGVLFQKDFHYLIAWNLHWQIRYTIFQGWIYFGSFCW